MNLSSMEYFVALARERSFTKAAQQLHIEQQLAHLLPQAAHDTVQLGTGHALQSGGVEQI